MKFIVSLMALCFAIGSQAEIPTYECTHNGKLILTYDEMSGLSINSPSFNKELIEDMADAFYGCNEGVEVVDLYKQDYRKSSVTVKIACKPDSAPRVNLFYALTCKETYLD